MRALKILVFSAVVLTVAASSAPAHHSFAAEFDRNRPTKMTGTVTKVLWQNPHTFFYIDVKDEKTGKVANWGIEMGSPNILMRNGWRRDTMKIGDVVVVDGHLAKDNSNTANASSVVLAATGKRLFAGSSLGTTP
jgi:hypothetical protein